LVIQLVIDFYNGNGGRIVSIADDNGGRNIKSYINGSLNTTTAYNCSLVRYPFIDISGSSSFIIGNVNTPNPSSRYKWRNRY